MELTEIKIEYTYTFADGTHVSVGEKIGIGNEWLDVLKELDREEYNNMHAESRRHVSLEAADQDDNQIPYNKNTFEDIEELMLWNEMCSYLTPLERCVGNLLFRQGYTQFETADIMGISRPKVMRIVTSIKKKLKIFKKNF